MIAISNYRKAMLILDASLLGVDGRRLTIVSKVAGGPEQATNNEVHVSSVGDGVILMAK